MSAPTKRRCEMAKVEMKLELIQVPVSDVDRAKAFYTDKAGFNADHDHQVSDEIRFVQLTPPGSPTSIAIGTGITDMAPGTVQGLQMVVPTSTLHAPSSLVAVSKSVRSSTFPGDRSSSSAIPTG